MEGNSDDSDSDTGEIKPNTQNLRGVDNSGTTSDEYEADDESYGKNCNINKKLQSYYQVMFRF